jgi:hypothetical protein
MGRLAVAVAASLIVACSPQATIQPVAWRFSGDGTCQLPYSFPSANVLRLGADGFDRAA